MGFEVELKLRVSLHAIWRIENEWPSVQHRRAYRNVGLATLSRNKPAACFTSQDAMEQTMALAPWRLLVAFLDNLHRRFSPERIKYLDAHKYLTVTLLTSLLLLLFFVSSPPIVSADTMTA